MTNSPVDSMVTFAPVVNPVELTTAVVPTLSVAAFTVVTLIAEGSLALFRVPADIFVALV